MYNDDPLRQRRPQHTHFTSDKGHTHTDTPTLEGRQSRADQLTGWASSGAHETARACGVYHAGTICDLGNGVGDPSTEEGRLVLGTRERQLTGNLPHAAAMCSATDMRCAINDDHVRVVQLTSSSYTASWTTCPAPCPASCCEQTHHGHAPATEGLEEQHLQVRVAARPQVAV